MARGFPDYQNPAYAIAARQVDFSDVVTSVLGTNTIDGRGRLWWVDTFRTNVSGWLSTKTGDGVVAAIDNTLSEIPPNSCKLVAGTVAGGGTVSMFREQYIGVPRRAGFQFSFWYQAGCPITTVQMYYSQGNDTQLAQFVVDPQSGNVTLTHTGGTEIIANLYPSTSQFGWATLKLVADFSTGKYVRFLYGLNQVDLDSYTIGTIAWSLYDTLRVRFQGAPFGAAIKAINVGHVLLTTDEP